MPKTQTSVVDEIASLIPPRTGFLPWYERVNKDQAEMLAAILEGWKSGRFGTAKNTAAKTISQYLERHGIKIGRQGVITWLARHGT